MADVILGPLVDVTISKVISVTTEQLNLAVGFKQELKKFRVVLSMVRGVLQDAEEKKVTVHSDLQPWLQELGNIVDEADNVVDEVAYEHLRYKVAQKQMWKKVSCFFTLSNPLAFRLKIAKRIKYLNLDLASLNDWATGLGLQHRLANKLPEHVEIQQTNSSLDDPSKIVGRENKVLEVVQSLIDSSNGQPLPVVSIVGMGGIGKTTMAKLVYNNELIQKHFYKKMWVCVSENFDEKKILAMMLKSLVTNEDGHVDFENEAAVVQKLKEMFVEKNSFEEIEEKNYLLILDDVWNEEKPKWDNLRNWLLGIGKRGGSRVLVTTRNEKVASIMGTKNMHSLAKLEKEDCWSIIRLKAFGNFPNSSELEELESIGRNIAEKCKGVALVANVVGGTLCNNINKDYWTSIRDDKEVWDSIEKADGVLCVLQLSFDRLPIPALKQCFAFCSIFPKDFVMEKEMLIQLWMGEGYLQPSRKSYKKMEDIGYLQPFRKSYKEMEDIGGKYFNDLFSYSLFQDAVNDSSGSIISCKMHDLIHDLAQSVSESQTLIWDRSSSSDTPADIQHLEDGSSDIPIDIRHLNLISEEGMPKMELRELRTLFSRVDVSQNKLENFIKVRVLSFRGASIDELPAFLGKMKHLRFLDVSETKIKELPKFITKLYHLQTFRFMNCGEIKRPLNGIWDLVNLRHIYFNDEKLMPAGIGGLTCLKTLQLFVVGQQKGHQIEELGRLSQLRGNLEIRNLDMVRDKEKAKGARLSEKDAIQELQLVFSKDSSGSEDRCTQDKDILEDLQPHSNLKGLIIKCYCGKSCPPWMLEKKNFLKNLMFMTFFACLWLESIPSLSLSKEAKVEINYCKNLKSIACSSLQKLIIRGCEELFEVEVGPDAMKSLKEVHIEICDKLENLPMISKLQSLEKLGLWYCSKLRMIGDDARFASTCLQELNIHECRSLMSMSSVDGLSSLQKIEMHWCGQLKSIGEDLSTATCLKELTVSSCNGLMSFPNLHGLSSLQKIKIDNCGQLKSIGENLSTATSLKELIVSWCNGLMSFPNLHGLSSLQKIEISWCGQLKSIGEDLSTVTCLKELTVQSCDGLMSFPNLHGLSSLQRIEIRWCEQLKSIGEDLSTATCLKELIIHECDGLMSFPNLHGLSSLQKIEISWCEQLKSIGEDLSTVTCLEVLIIDACHGLMCFPNLHGLSSLQIIEISWCEQLKSIGEDLSTVMCLKELTVKGCDGLMSFPNLHGLSSLQTLLIWGCGGLRSLPSGLPSCTALEKLDISNCDNLISIPDDLRSSWSTPNPACLACLKKLTIGGFSKELKEFPDLGFIGSHLEELTLIAWGEPRERLLDQIRPLTALKSLGIRDFDGLEALPNWFGNLSSLKTLEISNCKSLKHMKAIQRLSKLESLLIYGCPELKERCASGSGSEWDYISRIPKIYINDEMIQLEGDPIEIPTQLHQDDDGEQQDDDGEQQVDDNEQQDDDSEQLASWLGSPTQATDFNADCEQGIQDENRESTMTTSS
ncbi:hypothetical protein SLEP1_g28953 [Rubroshorea leprosula]|uniref:Uncharacterized protein n=1 Tax=Rubroshorea leprosula TaxID=152421 RepID=A0AAV5JVC3_9ROSI|nr:hypothetical protein SLEP1_g28953 [Rubroshorea leprosula]